MATSAHFLADTSALARMRFPQVSAVLSPLMLAGDVATCGVIELELAYNARSYRDLQQLRQTRSLAFPLVPITQADFSRALDVMEQLARNALHRSVGIEDLLIASTAEREGLVLLHYDSDFDSVTTITGQPTRWVVPRSTVP